MEFESTEKIAGARTGAWEQAVPAVPVIAVLVVSAYIAAQMLSDIASLKIGVVLGLAVDMGTFIYPITFTLRDLGHKALGKRHPQGLVITAGVVNLFMAGYLMWAASVPSDPSWGLGEQFSAILAPVWRIVLASIAGVAIGMALALLPTVEVVVSPYLDALNAMPRIALAPVFVVVFGLTIHSKVALAFSIVVFIVLTATRAGVRSVDIDLMRLSESLGANKWQMFSKILLPVATPAIFGALRLGVIYSLLGAVTSELIAAREGIGQVLQQSASLFKIDAVYGILILLAVIATVLNLGMVKLEQWILRWQPPNS